MTSEAFRERMKAKAKPGFDYTTLDVDDPRFYRGKNYELNERWRRILKTLALANPAGNNNGNERRVAWNKLATMLGDDTSADAPKWVIRRLQKEYGKGQASKSFLADMKKVGLVLRPTSRTTYAEKAKLMTSTILRDMLMGKFAVDHPRMESKYLAEAWKQYKARGVHGRASDRCVLRRHDGRLPSDPGERPVRIVQEIKTTMKSEP